jgi:hypothetical protein
MTFDIIYKLRNFDVNRDPILTVLNLISSLKYRNIFANLHENYGILWLNMFNKIWLYNMTNKVKIRQILSFSVNISMFGVYL